MNTTHIVASNVRGSFSVRVVSVHSTRGEAIDACPAKAGRDVYEVTGASPVVGAVVTPVAHASKPGVMVIG